MRYLVMSKATWVGSLSLMIACLGCSSEDGKTTGGSGGSNVGNTATTTTSGSSGSGGSGSVGNAGSGGSGAATSAGGTGGTSGTSGTSGTGGSASAMLSFFVTSRPVEVGGQVVDGGNFGGIAGADMFCTTLAGEVLPGNGKTWRAYLSTTIEDARDRIGTGPWYNANGQLIANDVNGLHNSPPDFGLMLNEMGGAADANSMRHDIITGSKLDGTRFASLSELEPYFTFPDNSFEYTNHVFDATCADWTENGTFNEGVATIDNYAVVGHVDGSTFGANATWNSSHVTACDVGNMAADQGSIRIYCFAL